MDGTPHIPPEAWDAILKSGNAVAVIFAFLWFRTNETLQKVITRVAVLEARVGVKGKSENDQAG